MYCVVYVVKKIIAIELFPDILLLINKQLCQYYFDLKTTIKINFEKNKEST